MSDSLRIDTKWHSIDIKDVFKTVNSGENGLNAKEAKGRIDQYGYNRIKPPKKQSEIMRFLMQFNNVLIYVLIISAIITLFLKDIVDSVVIFGVIFLNALIGYVQEGKAQKAVDAIKSYLTLSATVIRDGEKKTIPAEELVPGDVVMIQSGDKVPADIRLFKAKDLKIQEAALTGESVPAEKNVNPVSSDVSIGDRLCMAFSGSLVSYGQGYGVVVSTGDNSEIGKISQMISETATLKTPLTIQMDNLARLLTFAITFIAGGTMFFGWYVRDISVEDIFMSGVALAVAAIPEGLPAIITITLALGVQRMAKKNAIIRKLPAVETLGSTTVICSDKTGTLTKNEMTVSSVFTSYHKYSVTGSGYEPSGSLIQNNAEISWQDDPILSELIYGGYLCNDSHVRKENNTWEVTGDPTEAALVVLGMKSGLTTDNKVNKYLRLDTIPFESERKYMAVLFETPENEKIIYVKGSPEKILELCAYQEVKKDVFETIHHDYWHNIVNEIGENGERTLAVAYKKISSKEHLELKEDDMNGLVMLGILGIIDPVRQEAIEAVKQCRDAGIRVKMITGDHAKTACAIGQTLGICENKIVVTGKEIDEMDDIELKYHANEINVFARVSPENKLKLVEALQANGEIAAMTGDGVNDAPALKRASIGIAMGKNGTEAAKEASDMVLADDNFATIAHAVKEGRTVYDNIRKALVFALPTNGAQAGMIIAAIFANTLLPMTPLQILWINLVTAVTLALALSFEPSEKDVMKRKPVTPGENILSYYMIWRITYISILMVMTSLGLFIWETKIGLPVDVARTISVNCLIILQCFYLINCRFMQLSSFNIFEIFNQNKSIIISISIIILLQLLFTYNPVFNSIFKSVALPAPEWLRLTIFGIILFLIVEAEKFLARKIAG